MAVSIWANRVATASRPCTTSTSRSGRRSSSVTCSASSARADSRAREFLLAAGDEHVDGDVRPGRHQPHRPAVPVRLGT
ncbi:hypothetical protein [Actinocatenispora rupis]|uniref:hypothetical protein n=1 Tax=Actinocatenispora rupis TaxID=519421 RepID=UPI001EF2BE34|nr:hypothetical protein [Actinocatenispora rupis]